jgi:2-keto-3-deoxy-L-rhamnonate aldolase RhmA
MTIYRFRDILQSDQLALGTFLFEFASPGIGQILKHAGAQFVYVDMEHSGFSFETVKSLLRNLHDAGLASLVRPPSAEYHHVARALDMGAQGVVPPMMNAALAREVAKHVRYPPLGHRGAIFAGTHDDFEPGSAADKMTKANDKACFIALIETRQGVQDMEELAKMSGVDGFFVGHFDLSCDLGIPAQFDHPKFLEAFDHIVSVARAHGKQVGRLVASAEEGAALHARGLNLLLYSGDAWLLQNALAEGIRSIRKLASKSAKKSGR